MSMLSVCSTVPEQPELGESWQQVVPGQGSVGAELDPVGEALE